MQTPSAIAGLADMFLEARQTGTLLEGVPTDFVPTDEAQAFAVQDLVARELERELGSVMGWKVGAATPASVPFCAPIHTATILNDGAVIPKGMCHHFGLEAEIAYRFAQGLPLRETPWNEDEVLDAIGTIHAAIEIFDTRFVTPNSQDRLVHLADQGSHGAMIIGEGVSDWRDFHPTSMQMSMTVNGEVKFEHCGGNSAGDPRRLLVWLANHAAQRGFPFTPGTTIISGSTMGTLFVAPGTKATVCFEGLPPVHVQIADDA